MNEPAIRPFYIHVVVWGDRFIEYLLEYCIPSLLSPNNLPALKNRSSNRFLICTTVNDWQKINSSNAIQSLREFMEPVFLEIPEIPPNTQPCVHMGRGHILATDYCFKHKAYGIALTPDLILSDGSLQYLEKKALEGTEVVLCPAIRFAEDNLLPALDMMKVEQHRIPLTIPAKTAVSLAMKSFHSETRSYNYGSRYYDFDSPVTLQPIHNKGLLIHSLSWCPLMLDYGATKNHSNKTLETWTMDGDYTYQNFSHCKNIVIANDSDEVTLISWAPLSYHVYPLRTSLLRGLSKKYNHLYNKLTMLNTLTNPIYDALKVRNFKLPVFWHTEEMDDSWLKYEKAFQLDLLETSKPILKLFTRYKFLIILIRKIRFYFKTILKAACNDAASKAILIRKFRLLFRGDNYESL